MRLYKSSLFLSAKLSFIVLLAFSVPLRAQQVIKTYYDYRKTQIDEEYQANSAGYVNGYYKKYDRNGVVIEQGTGINGKLNGEYRKWATYSGTKELASVVTYKNGVLHGPAKYYGRAGILLRSGNFIDDEKEGSWEELYSSGEDEPCGFFKSTNIYKKGSLDIKSNMQSSSISTASGKLNVYITSGPKTEGTHKEYYYPCKKLYSEYLVTGGQIQGLHKMYYPSGVLYKEITYHYPDGKESVLTYRSYYPNGKIENVYDASQNPIVFEQYDERGEMTGLAKKLVADENQKKASLEIAVLLKEADSLFIQRKYDEAEKIYKTVDIKRGSTDSRRNTTIAKLKELFSLEENGQIMQSYEGYISLYNNISDSKELYALISKASKQTIDAMEQYFILSQQLKEQSARVNDKMVTYAEAYVKKTPTGATYNNEPIYATSYPKGKLLFEKSKLIIGPQLQEYRNGVEAIVSTSSKNSFGKNDNATHPTLEELTSKVESGKIVEANLDRMITLAMQDTDAYNKPLKKAKEEAVIKSIIGLK